MNRLILLAASCAVALGACTTSPNYARESRYYGSPGYDDRVQAGYYDRANPGYDDRVLAGDYDRANRGYENRRQVAYGSRCDECGTVSEIRRYDYDGRSTGIGAVAGAVVGGVLGNQVGGGSGRTAATVVGAVAGGVAGNAIENNQRNADTYVVSVRMDDGRALMVEHGDLRGIRQGDRVIVRGGRIVRL